MKKHTYKLLPLLCLIFFVGCKKNDDNNAPVTQSICEQNNTGNVMIHNNTSNTWWYSVPDINNTTILSSISANGLDYFDLRAGNSYTVTCYYPMTYNGKEYHWNRYVQTVNITQCDSINLNLNDDCSTHDEGYLVYGNATSGPITISIDGAHYDPIQPGDAMGYTVAAGVTHSVTAMTTTGNTAPMSPSVGGCQIYGTVIY